MQMPDRACLHPESVKDRYTILASLSCTPDTKLDLERTLLAYRLASTTLSLPTSLSLANPFSSEILSSHRQVIRLIQTLLELPASTENDSPNPANPRSLHPGVMVGNDTCDLCDAPIPFTDLDTAACLNGHQFPRCGLSFLAIQAPRITKSCGLCETVFLSEEFVKAQEAVKSVKRGYAVVSDQEHGGNGDATGNGVDERDAMEFGGGEVRQTGERVDAIDVEQAEEKPADEDAGGTADARENDRMPSVSLAKVLFSACDVCIYCGGKFVG
jgi:hypothetical protein